MKVAPILMVAFVICIAIPGSNQGKDKKPKPKYCTGKDGNHYNKGESYEDNEACIRYTCIKKGKKFKMKPEEIKCTESETDLAANVTAIEAGMKILNGSMKSMESKMEALQTSVESILGMITAMKSTSSKLEINITSNMDAISSNIQAISTNNNEIKENKDGIKINKDTSSATETKTAKLETCLGDVNSTDCPSSEDGKISMVDAINGNKEDIEALNKPTFRLVMTTGYNNIVKNLATSEILSSGGVCSQSIPPFPEAVYGAQSVYFNNALMVCGGWGKTGYHKQCRQLRHSKSHWTEGPAMNIAKCYLSMTKAGQDLYALGGIIPGEKPLDSMEKLSESSGEWTMMEQKLTSPRERHCTVFMETTGSLVIIGGKPITNLVEEFNIATASWNELTPLPVALYGHACVQLDQKIVVTGGWSDDDDVAQKNVYTFAGGQWETTGELQVGRHHHSMGILDNKILVLGGQFSSSQDNYYYDTIEEMQQDGSFQILEWKLGEVKGYSATAQVPSQMFPCL